MAIVVGCWAVASFIYASRAAIVGLLVDAAATLSTQSVNIAMIDRLIIRILIFILYTT